MISSETLTESSRSIKNTGKFTNSLDYVLHRQISTADFFSPIMPIMQIIVTIMQTVVRQAM